MRNIAGYHLPDVLQHKRGTKKNDLSTADKQNLAK